MKERPPVSHLIKELSSRDLLPLAGKVAKDHHVTVEEMLGDSRFQQYAIARHAMCHALVKGHNMSYPFVGKLLGLDSTTVLHAVRRHEKRVNRPTV